MNLEFYAIFDKPAGLYGLPFSSVNEVVAKRQFKTICEQSEFDSTDLDLYKIGSFDTLSGKFVACEQPVFVAHGGVTNA